jgi:hypothetical protein
MQCRQQVIRIVGAEQDAINARFVTCKAIGSLNDRFRFAFIDQESKWIGQQRRWR